MKVLPRVVKNEVRLARFLKKKLNFAAKSLSEVKFIAKSTISSKGKAGEKQNLHETCQGTWKFPCTLLQFTQAKVHGNFHVPFCTTHAKVHGNFHVPCCITLVKVHGNFHVPEYV